MAKQLNVNLAVTANTQQAKQQLQQLQQTLSSLTTNSANLKIGLDQTQLQQASKQLLELQAHLKAATNVDTGALDFTKLNNSIRNSGKTLTQYGQQLLALGPQGKEAFAQLAQSVAQSEVPIRRLSGLLGQFGTVLKNTIRWQISSSLIHGFMGSIQQAYGYAQDLNKSLNNIQIVTGLSDNQMAKFAKTANTAAKALSTTTTKYTDAALIYYQQGIRNEKEIADRTNATIKMANVTGQTAETVSNQMTAIWNNFADGSKSLEYYADVITALGAATASSSEEISQGLQKFAAVADTVGLSYENATAALATITATTRQSADTVGTGLRTLFSRLQGLSLGETLEDGVNLTKYSKALATVGVNALDAQGQLRNMDDVLSDLGNKWQSLSKAQQVALAQTVGGVRQYTTLVALMDNFDFYKQNLDVAKNSEGTLQKQQAIYEKSWEASAKRVKAAAETIYSSLINDQFFIKLNDGFAGFLDILNNIITGLGGMKGILLSLGGIITKVFSSQITNGIYNFATGIRNIFRSPASQRAERAQFVQNAGNLMAGGIYDAKTGKVSAPQGANAINAATQYQRQLAVQNDFVRNRDLMSDQQRQAAELAMQAADKAKDQQQLAMRNQELQLARSISADSVLRTALSSSSYLSYNDLNTNISDAVNQHQREQRLLQELSDKGYDNLTDADRRNFKQMFNIPTNTRITAKNFEDFLVEGQRVSSDRFAGARRRITAWGGEEAGRALDERDLLGTSNRNRSKSDKEWEQAQKNAEELAKQRSQLKVFSDKATSVGSAVMSAFAATQGIESFTSTIAKAQAGLMSTKDAAIQCGAAIGQIAMNGIRTFTSLSSVMGPIAGGITTIALVALPYILDLIDNLHTSPEELLENLAAGTERAQKSAEAAKTAYDNLINGFSSHSSLLDTLSELTEGTLEFQQALLDANIAAYKLINDNKLSLDDWFIDERGAVQIKPEAYERLRQEAIQKQREENVYQYAARSIESNTQVAQLAQSALSVSDAALEKQRLEAQAKAQTLNDTVIAPLKNSLDISNSNSYTQQIRNINKQIRDTKLTVGEYRKTIREELTPQLTAANSINLPNNASPGQWSINSIISSNYGALIREAFGLEPLDGDWFNAIARNKGSKDAAWQFIMENGSNLLTAAAEPNYYGSNYRSVPLEILDKYPNAAENIEEFRGVIEAWIAANNNEQNTPQGDSVQKEIDRLTELISIAETATIPDLEAKKQELFLQQSDAQTRLGEAQLEYAKLQAQANPETFKPDYKDQNWIDTITSWAKDKGLSPELVMAGIQAGTLYHDLSVNQGAATDNMIALQNARLLETGKEKLSTSEQLIIQGLSTSKVLQEAITSAGENLKYDYYKAEAVDEKTVSKIKQEASIANLAEDVIAKLKLSEVESLYLKNAPNSETAFQELQDIQDSEQYKSLDEAAKKRFIADKLYQKRSTEAMQKAINDAYSHLGEERQKTLDNIKNLTVEQVEHLAEDLLTSEHDDVKALALPVANFGNEILTNFLTAAQSTFDGLKSPEYEAFKEKTKNLTLQEQEDVTNLRAQFANIYGDKTANLVFEKTAEDLAKGSQTIKNIFTDFQSTGSMITDLANINARTTSLGTTQLAKDFYASIKQDISEKGLFEELYNSEDFAEGLKSLRKELKKTGTIGADSLVALADQSELLSNYLEVSGTNVQGLADALNLLETGKIDEMSSALLAALSAAGEVNSNLAQTYAYIDNFKEERSITDIGGFMKKRADAVKAGFESGMLLDAPLLQSMEALFGSDMRSKYQQDIYDWTDDHNLKPEDISKKINDEYKAEITAMQSIQERGNLSGMFEYYAEKNPNGGMFTYNKETGQVVATNQDQMPDKWKSQDGFIQALQDNYGMSETMARAMASEYAATNGDIAQLWRTTAANQGMTALTETAKDEILTGDEARAFYDQYKDVLTDYTEDSFLKKIAEDAEKTGKAFIDLGKDFDVTTASIQQFKDAYEKNNRGKTFTEYLGLEFGEDDKLSNLEAATKRLTNLGMTAAQAYETINDELGETDEARLEKLVPKADQADFATFRQEHAEITTLTEAWVEYQAAKQEAAKKEEVAKEQAAIIQSAIEGAITTLSEKEVQLKTKVIEVDATAITGKTYEVRVHLVPINTLKASGYNNAGFAGGKHSNGQYEGMAEVGELGPELFIHDGQPYLAGIHGRTKAYVHKDDQIYTAAQTKKILRDNPSLQDIPAFSVGYNQVSWGDSSNANADNAKTSKWEPERYHLITRQIKDLQREYERLSKIKDNAYGTNKLEAIQKEIDATNQLIEGQKRLVKEAEDYLKIDTDRITKLLKPGEFQLDANGNLANFEELQQKYRKAAEEKKDKKAEEIWKALMQYEETLDKLHEADEQMRELIYQQMELRLETITTKVDLKINFDEKEIKLIDHYIGKIDDNIYDTAQVLVKTGDKLAYISRKIDDTKEGLAGLFEELSDSEGNLIRKEDGSAYTMEEWLALSEAERDALNINGKFGEQLEEYMDNILEYIEELEEFKTKGVEEFGEAFEQLNSNVRESIDLFDHYNSLMETLKNIVSLQGAKISPELQTLIKHMDALMFQNTQNNLQAEQQNYERLKSNVEDLKQKIANTTDETLKRAWEEQLKTAENEMRTSQQNLYQLWETGLQQAKDRFDTSLDEAVQNYERKLSGIYGTIDDLQKAWNRKKRNTEFYEPDFEKYYQINRLQRTINNDLANQLKNGFKQSEGLKKLYKDLNDARADGVQLTAYDLDMYQKRYEYEKALMDLEDSRNAKTQVRLQRDANGNWGYVYTSNIDEDELLKKEQAVEDAFYKRQKTAQDRLSSLSDDIMSEIGDIATTIQGMRSRGADEEAIQDYLKDIQGWLNNYKQGLATALHDADITEEEARQRYGAEGFDIIGTFGETLLSAIMGDMGDLDTFFATIQSAMEGTNEEMQGAATEYQQAIIDMNKWFDAQGENFIGAMTEFASAVAGDSNTTLQHLIGEEGIINDAKNTFSDILKAAEEFEKKFLEIYQPIIDANEQLVADLLKALDALNRHEYKQDTSDTTGSGDTGTGGTGSSGTGGTSDSGSGSGDSEDKVEYVYDYKPYNSEQHEVLRRKKHSNGKWVHDSYQAHSFVQISAGPSSIKIEKCSKCGYTKTTEVSRSYATGGLVDYTGPTWVDGTKSHPESFLNATDTKNILDTAYILRTLNLQAMLAGQGFGKLLLPTMSGLTNSILDQNVTITASFPNATNHSEIEEAFTNLINKASQYANRKGY